MLRWASTADLIRELRDVQCGGVKFPDGLVVDDFEQAALVVRFENGTGFVPASEENALERLNELVRKGGAPIGTIAWRRMSAEELADVFVWPLAEYEGEQWAHVFLGELLRALAEHSALRTSRIN